MSEYNNPRPIPTASASDPCTIVDNSVSLDKVINGDSTVTTYQGKQILSLSQAIDKFGFGVAPFTFTNGGTLESKNLLVSNDPVDSFLYKYVGSGSFPLTVTAGTNPTVGIDWQPFAATDHNLLSNRNAAGAHDEIYRRKAFIADIESGTYQEGSQLCLPERSNASFDVVNGGVPDGKGILDAGNGNTAVIIDNGETVKIRSLGYTFGADASPFIEYAANKGYKKIILPKSDSVLMSQIDTLNSSWVGVKIVGAGSGLAYTPNTRIKPIIVQDFLFSSGVGVSGVDSITFDNLMLDGDGKCKIGVSQKSGAGWNYTNLQLKGFIEWGLYSTQGLNWYNRIYGTGGIGLGVIAAYSDSILDTVECTGGAEPIKIMAGGCRLDNILANSGTESCITLEPLDTNTNHTNTALSNIYIGEVINVDPRPHLKIAGNATRRVTDVQIVNLHTVSASAIGVKHNRHISINKADRVLINGWAALGIGPFETANLYDDGGIDVTDSTGVDINSATIHNLSKNPIVATNSEIRVGSGVTISDWSGAFDSNPAKPAILSDDLSKIKIDSDSEFINARVASTKIGASNSGALWNVGTIRAGLAGTQEDSLFSFTSNQAGYRVSGFDKDYLYKGVSTYNGTVITPAGGGAVTLKTFPVIAENRNWLVTVQQNGTGANATIGMAFTFNATLGAVTTGNTNSATVLQNTITAVGSDLKFTSGSGYGETTWNFNITRQF